MLPWVGGLAAGALHVLAGPDHLAAVAPLSLGGPRRGARLGLWWGLGHALGAFALGTLGQLGRTALHVQALGTWSELLVGVALVCVGAWALHRSRAVVIHSHDHDHHRPPDRPVRGAHGHVHVHMGAARHDEQAHARHTHATFGLGALHGAAGTGHLLGVLPSLAFAPLDAALYLTAYGAAATGAMVSFGYVVGRVGRGVGPAAVRALLAACGVAAVALGLFWIVSGLPIAHRPA